MFLEDRVAAGSAATPQPRTMHIALPPGDEAEMIALLGDLLGWQPAPAVAALLCLRADDAVMRVDTVDPALARLLARNGLDRLVRPLQLPALEQLMVVAG